MIKKGDLLAIRPEWRNPGEHQELYVAREDEIEDHDYLQISAVSLAGWAFWPIETVKTAMVLPLGQMIAFPLLIKQFPDYDISTLPPIPAGWVDSSWHNDACPSFIVGHWQIFIDYALSAQREFPDHCRYSVLDIGTAGLDVKDVLCTDNWYRVISTITTLQQETTQDVVQG